MKKSLIRWWRVEFMVKEHMPEDALESFVRTTVLDESGKSEDDIFEVHYDWQGYDERREAHKLVVWFGFIVE